MTKQIGSTLIVGQDKQNRTQQGQNHRTTLNTAKVHADHDEAQAGDQAAAVEDQSKEERAVHQDVTKGPCSSTLVLINITPSTIEAS
jgi:hypothetical protein